MKTLSNPRRKHLRQKIEENAIRDSDVMTLISTKKCLYMSLSFNWNKLIIR